MLIVARTAPIINTGLDLFQAGIFLTGSIEAAVQNRISNVDSEFLTISEVARWVRVSPKTVSYWIRSGQLPAIRLGRRIYRITPQAVLTFLHERGYELPAESPEQLAKP